MRGAVNLSNRSGLPVLRCIERTKLLLALAVPAVRHLTPRFLNSIDVQLSALDLSIRKNCLSVFFPYLRMISIALDRLRSPQSHMLPCPLHSGLLIQILAGKSHVIPT